MNAEISLRNQAEFKKSEITIGGFLFFLRPRKSEGGFDKNPALTNTGPQERPSAFRNSSEYTMELFVKTHRLSKEGTDCQIAPEYSV